MQCFCGCNEFAVEKIDVNRILEIESTVHIFVRVNCLLMVMKSGLPFNAITLLAGFMMAESAVIGRRIGLFESFMSMMTTWLFSPVFSRTQMNLSDSIVSEVNEMEFA